MKKGGYRFLLGDLNFRLSLNSEDVLYILNELRQSQNLTDRKKRIKQLLDHDQLYEQVRTNKLLTCFAEADINFNPTYKMEPSAHEYKVKKGRTPSWYEALMIGQTEFSSLLQTRANSKLSGTPRLLL